MANALSDYVEGSLLAWLKGTVMPTAPAGLYVGLFTTLPADTGTSGAPADGVEVTGASYARQLLTLGAVAVNGTTQQVSQSGTLTFPTTGAAESWGTVVAYGVWDASTGGHLLWYGALSANQAVGASTTFSMASGNVALSLD